MGKPIQEQIFKSRLTITYRTEITGTPQQETLPYRLLVLGKFQGRAKAERNLLEELAKRQVRSIKRGTTVNHHMSEMVPVWRLPDTLKALRASIPGTVTFEAPLVCSIPNGSIDRKEIRAYPLSGKARFKSTREQNGLADIDGELVVTGTLDVATFEDGGGVTVKGATLFISGMVQGDYIDLATSKKIGLVTGLLPGQSDPLAADKIKVAPMEELDLDAVDSKVKRFVVTVAAPLTKSAERTVPFTALDDFTPDKVVAGIPELHRLRVLKQLLLELQSNLRNHPELRKQMRSILQESTDKKEDVEKKTEAIKALQQWANDNLGVLKLEPKPAKKDDQAQPTS